MAIVKSYPIHLIEDIWCDYNDLWLIYQVFGWIEIESCMKNKKDNKTESENIENLTASILAECTASPTATETWWTYFYVKLDI